MELDVCHSSLLGAYPFFANLVLTDDALMLSVTPMSAGVPQQAFAWNATFATVTLPAPKCDLAHCAFRIGHGDGCR